MIYSLSHLFFLKGDLSNSDDFGLTCHCRALVPL
uniref:Uncharacterized protein n=1 Tax=Anguilla anguilla TaxID=7936 RepID=A0A0E9QX86_ANGAN